MKKITLFTTLAVLVVCSSNISSPVYADQSPAGCKGSALGLSLFPNVSQVNIGDTISYSINLFNGLGSPTACDATEISASITTPDNVNHPISLVRTTLTHGQSDLYSNIISYITNAADLLLPDNIFHARANTSGTIHQNEVNSQAGVEQQVNVAVVPEFSSLTSVVALAGSALGYLGTKNKKLTNKLR